MKLFLALLFLFFSTVSAGEAPKYTKIVFTEPAGWGTYTLKIRMYCREGWQSYELSDYTLIGEAVYPDPLEVEFSTITHLFTDNRNHYCYIMSVDYIGQESEERVSISFLKTYGFFLDEKMPPKPPVRVGLE